MEAGSDHQRCFGAQRGSLRASASSAWQRRSSSDSLLRRGRGADDILVAQEAISALRVTRFRFVLFPARSRVTIALSTRPARTGGKHELSSIAPLSYVMRDIGDHDAREACHFSQRSSAPVRITSNRGFLFSRGNFCALISRGGSTSLAMLAFEEVGSEAMCTRTECENVPSVPDFLRFSSVSLAHGSGMARCSHA